jgi:ubiquitin C-terminal hydrolase
MEITYCYKNLIEELTGCKNRKIFLINAQNYTSDEKTYYEPNDFKDLISLKNPLFKGIQANDSKDLIIFLLESMDNELTQRNNKNLPKEVFDGRNVEHTNEENFKKIHNSIFAEIFYGFQKSIMKCLSCGHADETYNVFNFLIFPLEKVYNELNKKKNNNNMNNNMNFNMYNMFSNMNNNMFNNMYNMYNNNNNNYNNNMNIYGNNMNMYNNSMNNMNMLSNMLMYNNMPNNMNINYSNHYNEFKAQVGNINQLNLLSYRPNYSKMVLNGNNKNNNEIPKLNLYDCFKDNENEEKLTGSNQIFCNHCRKTSDALTKNEMYKIPNVLILILNRGRGNIFQCDVDFPHQLDLTNFVNNPSSPKIFELIGVISHLGKSSMEGHFIACCKHFDENWYLFNDGFVTPISLNDIKRGTPYILFYQNINFN